MEEEYAEAMKMAMSAAAAALENCETIRQALLAIQEDEDVEFAYISHVEVREKALRNLVSSMKLDMDAFTGDDSQDQE